MSTQLDEHKIVTVELLKVGDRFEFITSRSEWADNCFLPHPKGVIIVTKSSFRDSYDQCRFAWRLEKSPNGRPQEWWGVPHVEVRLLGPVTIMDVEIVKKQVKKKRADQA